MIFRITLIFFVFNVVFFISPNKVLGAGDIPQNSTLTQIIDQDIMTNILSFHDIPSLAMDSQVCKYFKRIYDEDEVNRLNLKVALLELSNN